MQLTGSTFADQQPDNQQLWAFHPLEIPTTSSFDAFNEFPLKAYIRRSIHTPANTYVGQYIRRPIHTLGNIYAVQYIRRPTNTLANTYACRYWPSMRFVSFFTEYHSI